MKRRFPRDLQVGDEILVPVTRGWTKIEKIYHKQPQIYELIIRGKSYSVHEERPVVVKR